MLGDKIVKLRKLNNMTQSDLGTRLNISPQAVSKWERNISQPDFDTVKKLSKVFNVSITEFMEDDEKVVTDNQFNSKTKITCSKCGRNFEQKEIFTLKPNPICLECNEKSIEEKEEVNKTISNEHSKIKTKEKNNFLKSFLYAGLITFTTIIFLILCHLAYEDPDPLPLGYTILLISILAILTYCFSNQMFYDNFLKDFIDCFRHSFELPGLIFSLDLGGILLLILWKFIAPIIAFLISITIFLFGCVLAFFISPFTLIFSFIRGYKDYIKYLEKETL